MAFAVLMDELTNENVKLCWEAAGKLSCPKRPTIGLLWSNKENAFRQEGDGTRHCYKLWSAVNCNGHQYFRSNGTDVMQRCERCRTYCISTSCLTLEWEAGVGGGSTFAVVKATEQTFKIKYYAWLSSLSPRLPNLPPDTNAFLSPCVIQEPTL